jgi:molybdate transport system ATP-binding protein
MVSLVAEVTPSALSDLGLADGGEVWAAVKATEISVYPA